MRVRNVLSQIMAFVKTSCRTSSKWRRVRWKDDYVGKLKFRRNRNLFKYNVLEFCWRYWVKRSRASATRNEPIRPEQKGRHKKINENHGCTTCLLCAGTHCSALIIAIIQDTGTEQLSMTKTRFLLGEYSVRISVALPDILTEDASPVSPQKCPLAPIGRNCSFPIFVPISLSWNIYVIYIITFLFIEWWIYTCYLFYI